jgi:microcin C transport system substrate-binding protein
MVTFSHVIVAFFFILLNLSPTKAQMLTFHHGYSAFGELKYKSTFLHFDYVNPDAPKGGEIVLGALGTFDSLNQFIVKGTEAVGLLNTTATLLAPSTDETDSYYGYVAEGIAIDTDKKTITFKLNPNAKFDNGDSITSEDVFFSFQTLTQEGKPHYQSQYQDILRVEIVDALTISFVLKKEMSKTIPCMLGKLPIISKKHFTNKSFNEVSLEPFPCSGPYKVFKVVPGRFIVYEKVNNWWGSDLPSQKGLYNFDRIKVVYYRDSNILFEAFKSGEVHYRHEMSAKLWTTSYDFEAVLKGKIKRESLKIHATTGTRGFVFNARKPPLNNREVRRALTLLFDFTWANNNIFYNMYKRSLSYFPNSILASQGLPFGEEKTLLESLKENLHPDVFCKEFNLPEFQNEEERRIIHQQVLTLLENEGWKLVNNQIVNSKGEQFSFEFMIQDKAQERLISHFIQTLTSLGINAKIRLVEALTYQDRLDHLDFDMVFYFRPHIMHPGTELRDCFSSKTVAMNRTNNLMGIADPAVDALIEKVIEAKTTRQFLVAIHALDRVLLHGHYMIPNWYIDQFNIVYWDFFDKPKTLPRYDPINLNAWWFKHS